MSVSPDLYLASRSPRRRELLEQIGLHYQVVLPDVAELPLPEERPSAYVMRLALEKAQAGWKMIADQASLPVLGADTVVVLDNEILEKPRDQADALRMLERLSGRTHQVMTGMALVLNEQQLCRVSISQVTFRTTTVAEREAYWQSGEPVDKAGGYGIQGLAAAFVEQIEGSYSGIMGLSLYELSEMLAHYQIRILK